MGELDDPRQAALNKAIEAMADLNVDAIKLTTNAKGEIQAEIKLKSRDLTDPTERQRLYKALDELKTELKSRFNHIIGW